MFACARERRRKIGIKIKRERVRENVCVRQEGERGER